MHRLTVLRPSALVTAIVLTSFFVTAAEAGNGRSQAVGAVAVPVLLGVFLVLLAVVMVGGTRFDLAACREEDNELLEDRIAEAVREALGNVPILILADIPRTRRSPAVIELSGTVPTRARREAVLRVVTEEISSIGGDIRVEDRIEVEMAEPYHQQHRSLRVTCPSWPALMEGGRRPESSPPRFPREGRVERHRVKSRCPARHWRDDHRGKTAVGGGRA